MLNKLSSRIIFWYTGLIAVLVLVLLFFFLDIMRETHIGILKREMDEKIRFMGLVFLREPFVLEDSDKLKKAVRDMSGIIGLRVTIVDLHGNVRADSEVMDVSSMDNHFYRIEIKDSARSGSGSAVRYSSTLKHDFLYYARKSGGYIIRLSKSLEEVDHGLDRLRSRVLLFGIVIAGCSILIVIVFSGKITGSVRKTLVFAQKFSDGDYTQRIMNYSGDEMGEVQRALNRMADGISEKIASLEFEHKKLEITLETITDAIAVIGNDKRIIVANGAFRLFFDMDRDPTGSLYYEVVRSGRVNSNIEKAVGSGSGMKFEDELLGGRYCHINISPIKEESTLQGVIIVLHDFTERKKLESMKADLVSNLSHELKTPVAIMKGYLETVLEGFDGGGPSLEYIKKALDSAERQNSIINDILKLNMLESAPDLEMTEINPGKIITGCIDILSVKAVKKGLEIKNDFSTADCVVNGNAFLAEEIFFNIIDNAVNYTNPPGTVTVSAEKTGGSLTVRVRDTGIGIPAGELDRIFERFYRVDRSRSRDTGGTGLGLSIVKHAAGLLGWRISVESGGDGTVFAVVILLPAR
ncbi:MAG: ATP-binding protein [Spirochaetes bacterium]|nr:ATP-binding protein [Spirochaetota bacterium]